MAVKNNCERLLRWTMLKIATMPATNCINTNSKDRGTRKPMMMMVIICTYRARRLSKNARIMMGTIHTGKRNNQSTSAFTTWLVMNTIKDTESRISTSLRLSKKTSRLKNHKNKASTTMEMLTRRNCPAYSTYSMEVCPACF